MWVATVFCVARTHLARPDLGSHAHVRARQFFVGRTLHPHPHLFKYHIPYGTIPGFIHANVTKISLANSCIFVVVVAGKKSTFTILPFHIFFSSVLNNLCLLKVLEIIRLKLFYDDYKKI